MSAIRDGRYPVEIEGKKYNFLFSLNALEEIQDRFGGYENLNKVFDKDSPTMIKDLKWLLTLLINEGMEEGEQELTEKQVGKMIHVGNMSILQTSIFSAFKHGVAGNEEQGIEENETGEAEGNQTAVQEK